VKLAERLAEERRSVMLQAMDETTDYRLNERSAHVVLGHFGLHAGADEVRADLMYCETHRLITLAKIPSGEREVWVATLTPLGQEVARGRAHVGIMRPGPP
jgi:hypothetical protein